MRVRSAARIHLISLPLVAAGVLLTAGCDSAAPPPKKPTPVVKSGEDHDHDHDHDDDHGHHHHHHAEKGPHGGALVAIGDDAAHLEVVLDAQTGKVTAYVLDGEAEKPVSIKAASLELTFALEADDHDHEEGDDTKKDGLGEELVTGSVVLAAVEPDEAGLAAEFSGIAEALKGAAEFDASVKSITIAGKEFKEVKFEYPEGNEHDHHHH